MSKWIYWLYYVFVWGSTNLKTVCLKQVVTLAKSTNLDFAEIETFALQTPEQIYFAHNLLSVNHGGNII